MMEYVCPNCNHHMHVPESRGGQHDRCERCDQPITYPDPAGLNTTKAQQTTVPDGSPLPPAPANRKEPRGRFSLNWGGLSVSQQISVIGVVLTLILILMCAGFGWPRETAAETEAVVVQEDARTAPLSAQ